MTMNVDIRRRLVIIIIHIKSDIVSVIFIKSLWLVDDINRRDKTAF